MIVWKFWKWDTSWAVATIGFLTALIITSPLWLKYYEKNLAPKPVVSASSTSTSEPWWKTPRGLEICVDFSGKPLEKQRYQIVLRNKCGVALNDFTVTFKFYDANDNRVGWVTEGIRGLEVGERVRWQADLPLKDYPQMGDGIGSIKPYAFVYDHTW